MGDLYLVRHGQASLLNANYDQLSAVGEQQSSLLGHWLARCGHAADAVATGTLSRQIRTAELCLAAMGRGPPPADWVRLEALNEIETADILAASRPELARPGALQAALAKSADPRRTFQSIYATAIARWVSGEHDGDYVLHWRDFRDGVVDAFRTLTRGPARSVFAFSSGGPITAVVQHLLAIPDSHAFQVNWPLVNTGVTRIRFSATDGRASLSVLNGYPHLEDSGDPGLVTFR